MSRHRLPIAQFGLTVVAAFLTCWVLNCDIAAAQDGVAATRTPIDFATEIKPIFETHCIRCHGPEEQDGDFRIDDRDSVSNYIDPGSSEFSDLYDFVSGEDEDTMMPPPDEGGPLDEELTGKIRLWIDQGAQWPDDVRIEMPPPEVVEEIEAAVEVEKADEDKQKGGGQLVWEIVGLLHPVLLHFPVALLIGGAFFAVLGFRGESPLSDAAYYCLWLGAWMAILACVSGWGFAEEKGYLKWDKFDFNKSIDVHRWGSIVIAVLAFLLALVAAGSRRRDPYGTGAFWKLSMVLLAILTGFVAHHGGKMTHDGLHDKLLNKSEILINKISGQNEQEPADEEGQQGELESQDEPAADENAGAADNAVDPDEGNAGTSKADDNGGDNK